MESSALSAKPSAIWTVLFGLSLVAFPLIANHLWNTIPLLRNGDVSPLEAMPWALALLASFVIAIAAGVFVVPQLAKRRKA